MKDEGPFGSVNVVPSSRNDNKQYVFYDAPTIHRNYILRIRKLMLMLMLMLIES